MHEKITGWAGYAHLYLNRLKEKSKSDDEINTHVYTKLAELDSKIDATGKEANRLNQLAQSILKDNGIVLEEHQNYDWIRKEGVAGYAQVYLAECWNDSKMMNRANVSNYRQLLDIDSNLGTNISLQLFACLGLTTRWNIIKV